MADVIFTVLVLFLAGLIHTAVLLRHDRAESRLLTLSLVAHLVSAFLQILMYEYYYEGGDMMAYYAAGVPLAGALRADFGRLFPMTVDVFFHVDAPLPFDMGAAGSTGSMAMAATWLLFLLGDSYLAVTLVIATLSYLAKVLIYRTLRAEFPREMHPTVLVAAMLVPSAVFWTSALLKEPLMMVFLGPLFLSLRWFLEGRSVLLATVIAVVSGTGVWLLKPYVLLSMAVASGLWIVWQRVLRERGNIVVKPLYLVLGLSLGIGTLAGVDRVLPSLNGRSLTSAISEQRRVSASIAGGSNFYLEDQDADYTRADEQTNSVQELSLVPLALATALLRPFLFEARNAVQAINALEMTVLLVLLFQVLRRQSLAVIVSRITASPTLMFCLAFTLVLALGTALATSNLGTLSRYRAPMMPFYVMLLLVLRKPVRKAAVAQPHEPMKPADPGALRLPAPRGGA